MSAAVGIAVGLAEGWGCRTVAGVSVEVAGGIDVGVGVGCVVAVGDGGVAGASADPAQPARSISPRARIYIGASNGLSTA